jgi:hypothetical protein
MNKLPGRMMKLGGVGAAVLVAFAAGCGGDDASTGASDAAGDQASQQDGSVADAQRDVTQGDSSSSDANRDANDSGNDATNPSDAASDATSEASPGTDAGDAAACVTTVASLGGGGVNDAGVSPMVLFSFDPGSTAFDGGLDPNWTSYGTPSPSLGTTPTDGHPCSNGALTLAVAQPAFSSDYGTYYSYSTAQDWTGYTQLHAWLKVVTTDYTTIAGVEPRVDSASFVDRLYGGFVDGTTFSGGGWHETIVALAPGASYVPATVSGFQFELQIAAAVDGGASTPPQATLLVDSIWIE